MCVYDVEVSVLEADCETLGSNNILIFSHYISQL